MKVKIFDVVELNDGNKATIVKINSNNNFKVDIVDNNGKSLGNECINLTDIKKIIYSK